MEAQLRYDASRRSGGVRIGPGSIRKRFGRSRPGRLKPWHCFWPPIWATIFTSCSAAIGGATFEIEFLDPGVEAFAFTFG